MKTYFINTIKNIAASSQSLDLVSTLKSQEWIVFNEETSYVEKFLFFDDDKLLVSVNGKSIYSKWQYIKVNSSLLIEDKDNRYLLKVLVCNKDIIVLNVDSTNDYSFLINSRSSALRNPTYEDIQWYLMLNCGIDTLNDEQRNQLKKERRIAKEVEQRKEQEQQSSQIIGLLLLMVAIVSFVLLCQYIVGMCG